MERIKSRIEGNYIVNLEHLKDSELSFVGSKAMRLGQLIRYGYDVPEGICICNEAYREFMKQSIPEKLILKVQAEISKGDVKAATRDSALIIDQMISAPIPQSLVRELRGILSLLHIEKGCSWAVRSSASEEDLESKSFAGVYSTYLHVNGEAELLEKIKMCWTSIWNDEAIAYRVNSGTFQTPEMSVVIQRMVEGDCSGVLFTANPHSGCTTEICINAVKGLNESLVSGSVTPDFYRLSKISGAMLEQSHQSGSLVLSEKNFPKLLKIALDVERLYGCPQDIEWTIIEEKIYLLQTRPITQLPAYFPLPDSLPADKDLKLAFVGLFSHFGASLEIVKNEVYCRAMKRLTGKFINYIQFIVNGYIYEYREIRYPFLGIAWIIANTRLWWDILHPRQSEQYFIKKVQKLYLENMRELEKSIQEEKTVKGFIGLLNNAVQNYFEFQRNSLKVSWLADRFSILLCRFVRYLVPVTLSDANIFEMLRGFESYTHRRENELTVLLNTACRDEELCSFLERCTADEFAQKLSEQSLPEEFLKYYQAFSKHYEYVWTSNNPKDAGWRMDYQIFLEQFRNHDTGTMESATISYPSNSYLDKINNTLNRSKVDQILPLRKHVFGFLCENARRFLPYRENRNHLFYRGVLSIRRIILGLGGLLAENGELSRPEDIFFLSLEEVRELHQEREISLKVMLDKKVTKRIDEYSINQYLVPSSTINSKKNKSKQSCLKHGSNNTLKGIACSSGVYNGKVTTIFSKSQLHKLRKGDILVCTKIRPFYSSLFTLAGALITEEGGMLSHGAILAREYGIPAVLNVTSITNMIRDGNIVTVDGDRGEIVIHSRGEKTETCNE